MPDPPESWDWQAGMPEIVKRPTGPRLNLGCGRDILERWVNVDHRKLPGVDVTVDLNGPWPWEDDSIAEIRAWHVFEHLPDLARAMDEAWRVLKPRGVLNVRVPHHRHRNADTDPTHIRRFTEHSFEYWFEGTSFEGFSDRLWKRSKPLVKGGRRVPLLDHVYLLPPHELEWWLTPEK